MLTTMKELTIEQKAKRFDEALAMAKECITCIPDDAVNKYMLNMFPELQKSEDERMKEAIIATVHLYFGEPLEDEAKQMIAWLEKQGEQNPAEWHSEDEQNLNACLGYIPDEYLRRWLMDVVHVKYDKSVDIIREGLEKQNEQKPIKAYLTIDEAIAHCKEKSCGNSACASQHKQLAQWLTELKEYKKQNNGVWHSADEEPDKDKEVLVEWMWSDCNPIYHDYHAKFNRRDYDRNKIILHWAYIVDLIKISL